MIPDADNDDDDEREWAAFGAEQFIEGYAESDAVYDELSDE